MHYYNHHIGDYLSHTANLSLLEHGVYLRLMQCYYMSESPLTGDCYRLVGARSPEERSAVDYILNTYFISSENGFSQERCDRDIAAYHAKSEKCRISVSKRWNNNRNTDVSDNHTDVLETDRSSIATNNQQPITKETPSGSGDQEKINIDYQSIVDLYHEILPELPGVRHLTEKRRKAIKSCCMTKKRYCEIEFWRAYFTAVRGMDLLMGRKTEWLADFDFLTRHSKFIKVIEGSYK